MKAHHLGLLIAAAVLALVAGLWTANLDDPNTGVVGNPLLPGLAESVNDVSGVKLTGAGNATIATLTRGDETWQLAEKFGHRADIAMVRELLLKLSRAKLLEEKTSNSDYYARLGVESIDAQDAGGVLVEIDGVDLDPVIIGDAEQAREAVYVRRADEPASWLASGNIEISRDLLQWLDRDIIDISASRIAEVEITHPDGEVVLITKTVFGQANYDVANIPAGRELKRANIANTIASVVEGLRVDDVLPADGSGFSELPQTRIAFRAFDGFVLNADAATKDDKYYVRFSADTDAATAAKYLPAEKATAAETTGSDAGGEAGNESDRPLIAATAEPDLSVVSAEAEKQNNILSAWVYVIPKSKYDQLTRRMTDLLKEPN